MPSANPFAGLVIGVEGKFGEKWSKQRLRKYIESNGGIVAKSSKDPDMTHLVCSLEAYKQRSFAVRDAAGAQVKIVSIDWLEDSLQQRGKKREGAYQLKDIIKEQRRKKKERTRERNRDIDQDLTAFAMMVKQAKAKYNLPGYHIYIDPTGFPYDVTLFRTDVIKNKIEKVVLRVYETMEPPHAYAAFATYFSAIGHEARIVLAPIASEFTTTLETFKQHFKSRTDVDWSDRTNKTRQLQKDGTRKPTLFTYMLPETGPLGMDLPPGRAFAFATAASDNDQGMSDEGVSGAGAEAAGNDDRMDSDDEESYRTADEGGLPGATRAEAGDEETLVEDEVASSATFTKQNPNDKLFRPGLVTWDWGANA